MVSGLAAAETDKPLLKRVAVIELNGPAGQLNHMAVNDDLGHLYIANKVGATLDIVDLKAGKLIQQIPDLPGSSGIDWVPNKNWVVMPNGNGTVCSIFEYDGKQYNLLKKIDVSASSKARYNPLNDSIYIKNRIGDTHVTSVYDTDLVHVTDITLPGNHSSFEMSKSKPRLYINNGKGDVYVVDTKKNAYLETINLELATINKPVVLDEANDRVFLGCRKPASVVIVDGKSNKEIMKVDVCNGMDDIAFDPKRGRVYVSCGEGVTSVVGQSDPDHYTFLGNVPTHKSARTCVFSPGLDLYILGVPKDEDMKNPEIWVYQPQ